MKNKGGEQAHGTRGRAKKERRGGRVRKGKDAITQEILKKSPSMLGELVRNNNLAGFLKAEPTEPPKMEIEELFKKVWDDEGRCDPNLPCTVNQGQVLPVTPNEVRKRIKRMKPNGGPGPDGIKKSNILGLVEFPSSMASISNLLLATGFIQKFGRPMSPL